MDASSENPVRSRAQPAAGRCANTQRLSIGSVLLAAMVCPSTAGEAAGSTQIVQVPESSTAQIHVSDDVAPGCKASPSLVTKPGSSTASQVSTLSVPTAPQRAHPPLDPARPFARAISGSAEARESGATGGAIVSAADPTGAFVQQGSMLLLAGLAVGLLSWACLRHRSSFQRTAQASMLQSVGQLWISPSQRLLLVEADGRRVLIGVTANSLTALTTWPVCEANAAVGDTATDGPAAAPLPFPATTAGHQPPASRTGEGRS